MGQRGVYKPNEYTPNGDGTTRIALTDKRGLVVAYAIIDSTDIPLVASFRGRWFRHVDKKNNRSYVRARPVGVPVDRRNSVTAVKLHRYIMGLSPGDPRVIDHDDNDGLNNTRRNLIVCTQAKNVLNVKVARKDSKTGIKNISFNENTYRASLQRDGVQHWGGRRKTLEEAQMDLTNLRNQYDLPLVAPTLQERVKTACGH